VGYHTTVVRARDADTRVPRLTVGRDASTRARVTDATGYGGAGKVVVVVAPVVLVVATGAVGGAGRVVVRDHDGGSGGATR
jgi:hypothetical protein